MSAETLRKAAEVLRHKHSCERCKAHDPLDRRDHAHYYPDTERRVREFDRVLADWLDSEVAAAEWREGQSEHMNADRVRPEPFPVYYDRTTEKAIALAALILGGA